MTTRPDCPCASSPPKSRRCPRPAGLADVSAALTGALYRAGHDVRLFTPAYASVDRVACGAQPVAGLQPLRLTVGATAYALTVLRGTLPGGTPVYLIDCPALFARPTLYTSDADEHVRFLAFTRAALLSCREMRWAPRIVHCNDWHTAFAPLLLRTGYRGEPLFAGAPHPAHDPQHRLPGDLRGRRTCADLRLHGRATGRGCTQPDLAAGRINALRHGILYADAINTVSPTYAREICTGRVRHGSGGQPARAQRRTLSGILNGVDYEEWDPRDRPATCRQHFDPEHLGVKAQSEGPARGAPGPRSGPHDPAGRGRQPAGRAEGHRTHVSRRCRGCWSARALNFVVLGSGEARYEAFFARPRHGSSRERVHFHQGYDDELAHWIEAASDLFLMPSRYEPCGLNQMYSLRYGTVPVVRRTGGLADSVQHFNAARR